MDALPKVGRYLFALPMAGFGVLHFLRGGGYAGMVPVPGGVIWVYFTGLCLLAAAVAIVTGKQAVLATRLLGVLLLTFMVSIHLVAVLGGNMGALANVLKDTALAGGAFALSGVFASEEAASDG